MATDAVLKAENDRLMVMLADLALRNGGTLEWENIRINQAEPVVFEFEWTDDGRILFRCYEIPNTIEDLT